MSLFPLFVFCVHTYMCFMNLSFLSNFLQEVPWMTSNFHWSPENRCPSLMTYPGKRNRPDHWCQSDIIWSWSSNMGAEPVHFHITEGLHPSHSPLYSGYLKKNLQRSCRASESGNLKWDMVSIICDLVPSKLVLLTWMSRFSKSSSLVQFLSLMQSISCNSSL